MQIETYEIEEHTTEGRDSFEIEAEAEALITSLGLDGQQKLLRASDDPDVTTKTRIPYRRMTAEEARVYKTLYPEASEVEHYDTGPIPLRVLQVVAYAKPLFDGLEVWGPITEDPDPVLVGTLKDGHRVEQYLLARWGDALEPFETLYDRALERLRKKWTAKANEVIAEAQSFIASPDALIRKHLGGSWVHEPWTG